MEASTVSRAWVDADGAGSHLLFGFPYDPVIVDAVRRLPGRCWIAEERLWAVPGLPGSVTAIRDLLNGWPDVRVQPGAESLLTELSRLPADARAVLHGVDDDDDPAFVLASPYDEDIVEAVRRVPGRSYDRAVRRWWIRPRPSTATALRGLADEAGVAFAASARALLEDLRPGRLRSVPAPARSRPVSDPHEDCRIAVVSDRFDRPWASLCPVCHAVAAEDLAARLGEGMTDLARERVGVPLDADHAPGLEAVLTGHAGLQVPAALVGQVAALAAEGRHLAELETLSRARESDFFVAGLGGTLHPFQRAAVAYALRTRRTFLADEQGLGKTVQALAALHAADAFPALVVCPASLRLNWRREIERWLPARSVEILGAGRAPSGRAEISVLNYDSLHKHAAPLKAVGLRALVLDESHYCKSAKARRTKAARSLAKSLPPDALLLALTGTPVLNRPAELMAQLTLLGRLEEAGGYRRFRHVYAKGEELDVLHRRLRQVGFVRRRKSEVLQQLPAKQRSVVAVDLDNRADYRHAENDVVEWLRQRAEQEAQFVASIAHLRPEARSAAVRARGEDAAERAARAEPLVRLTKLKLLAALGKLGAVVDWVRGFEETEEKLVVFAHHREVVDGLLRAFPDAAHLVAADSSAERQAAIDRFQSDPGCRLMISTTQVGGVGVTLTAASNVAFVELGWNPAAHDQAEDRLHRIGQSEQVTAWYLLAADTVDEKIAALIEDKRALIAAASDGELPEHGSVLGDLVTWLVGDDPVPGPSPAAADAPPRR